ncbi:MAG: type II toxin-antitoxin system PemK/MazF family toxin [Bacilli bacterium]
MSEEIAKIGDIWIVTIPVLTFEENENVNVQLQKRPCLILDDGRGLIVEEDRRNLHVLKLTTQRDPYKRKLIKNWKQLGLRRKSYIRIELPIKIEKEQLSHKIATLPVKQLLEMYSEVYNLINTQALEKMAKKYKEITKT